MANNQSFQWIFSFSCTENTLASRLQRDQLLCLKLTSRNRWRRRQVAPQLARVWRIVRARPGARRFQNHQSSIINRQLMRASLRRLLRIRMTRRAQRISLPRAMPANYARRWVRASSFAGWKVASRFCTVHKVARLTSAGISSAIFASRWTSRRRIFTRRAPFSVAAAIFSRAC